MTTEFDVNINLERAATEETELKIKGEYSDKMTEKMKREINTMIYTKNCYSFGYGIGDDWWRNPLATNCKGVLQE